MSDLTDKLKVLNKNSESAKWIISESAKFINDLSKLRTHINKQKGIPLYTEEELLILVLIQRICSLQDELVQINYKLKTN